MMHQHLNSPSDKESGITLIEMMLAMALTGFISILIYQTLTTTLATFHRGMDKTLMQSEVRAIIKSIKKDLNSVSKIMIYDQTADKSGAGSNKFLKPHFPLTREIKITQGVGAIPSKSVREKSEGEGRGVIRYFLKPTSSGIYELFRLEGASQRVLSSRVEAMNVALVSPGQKGSEKETYQGRSAFKGMKFFIRLAGDKVKEKDDYRTTLLYD